MPEKPPGNQARTTGVPARDVGGRMPQLQDLTQPVSNPEKQEGFSEEPRELLLRISSVVPKESLQSLLQALEGARLEGNSVILDPGDANDFYRRQVRDNLALLGQAASRIVGRDVTVVLRETNRTAAADKAPAPPAASSQEAEILEKAKREPIVQSFLDAFPGPVKAEKMDP
jgi:hypothetical protein